MSRFQKKVKKVHQEALDWYIHGYHFDSTPSPAPGYGWRRVAFDAGRVAYKERTTSYPLSPYQLPLDVWITVLAEYMREDL